MNMDLLIDNMCINYDFLSMRDVFIFMRKKYYKEAIIKN